MTERRDRVVIMARGKSARMGQPKGAVDCQGPEGVTFLAAIVRLYDDQGISGVVVTTDDLVELYLSLLPEDSGCDVVGFAGGGDTGLTLANGLSALEAEVTHLWAHPVDMPLVSAASIAILHRTSCLQPEALVRPVCGEVPGHPVIVPRGAGWDECRLALWRRAAMRDILAGELGTKYIDEELLVALDDDGVVADFDRPEDLI